MNLVEQAYEGFSLKFPKISLDFSDKVNLIYKKEDWFDTEEEIHIETELDKYFLEID